MTNKFYLTTAIPYVNGKPHIGHALEYFQADTIRNYYKLRGASTLLLSGADENALKNVQVAEAEGTPVQEFLDRNSQIWKQAYADLGVHLDIFQRGSDQKKHWPGVQALWELCNKNGDIYKKSYEGLYCIGCESFKTEKELINGLCPEHQKKPELIKEENYFFKLSKYQGKLIQLIESNELKITPDNKRSETLSFIKAGLEDFSISRSLERARGVGVPVPNDPSQRIYVWFDALTIYLTGIGFGTDESEWKKWWPADLHIIGKDINRFHTVYWPAMLLSAGLPIPKGVLVHSFVLSGGQKMSKSVGNVIDPYDIVQKFGLEPVRYYMLSQIPIDEDGDITLERLKEIYTADLSNGLGNLVSRLAKLVETHQPIYKDEEISDFSPYIHSAFVSFRLNDALTNIWVHIRNLDKKLSEWEPWKKTGIEKSTEWSELIHGIRQVGFDLQPFLPNTAKKVLQQFSRPITASTPLFPRIV